MSLHLGLAAGVLLLDAWAIDAVLRRRWPRRQTWRWIALIAGVPVVGVVLWWRARSRRGPGEPAGPDAAQ